MERVGIDDNFFGLGGDSIMSIQLVSRARKAGLLITPRAVFQHQTVAVLSGVATFIEETASTGGRVRATALLRSRRQLAAEPARSVVAGTHAGRDRAVGKPVPADRGHPAAVPVAGGLLFHALYDAQAVDVYTVQLVLGLQGPLDSGALQVAAQGLLDRHTSLRAGFQHAGLNQPVQIIVPRVAIPWRSIDLSLLDAAAREQRMAGILAEDRAARFDIACPPLVRFTLIRLAADQHRLVLTNHHILVDGWSVPVLVRELLTLYAHGGDPAALPRVTPYRDYLAWIAAQDRAAAISAWQEALAGLEEVTCVAPQDRARAPVVPERITLALSETLTTALNEQGRRQGLTPNTFIQAAWAILLGRLTGRDDVVFGVTVAGRPPEIAGIESMVGLFINTLPLRIKLPPAKRLLDLLRELQDSQSG